MRRTLTLLLLFSSSLLCWSQSPITVTGTVVDTSNHPATNGYIQFDLTPANQGLTYQIPPSTVIANSSKCKINLLGQPVDYITGAAPCLLWPNDLILPANTLYTVTLAPNGRVSRVYNNALFTVSVNPQSLATLRFIVPQPVIGTIINASPLVTQSMVPSNDLAWTIGQPNQRYVNIFTNSIYDYGLPDGCLNSTAFHIGSTGAPCIGGIVGSGANPQVAIWTGPNTLSGFANLQYTLQGISVGTTGVNGGISFIGSAGGSSLLQAQSNAGNGVVLMPSFAGSGTMAVTATSPLVLNSTSGNISLPVTAVTPGSYTNTNLTVDAWGRLTAASNGLIKLRCESGLGDGLNVIAVGTYLQSFCYNDSGVTWTVTGLKCFTDNNGTSTMNATNGAGSGLLTGAVTCTNSFATGTQSGTVTITSGDFIKFTFVGDGASKQTTWVVSMTQ